MTLRRPSNNKIPNRTRKRLRTLTSEIEKRYEYLVSKGLLKPVEEWDFEELSRGRPRNRSGGWAGRSPRWLTPQIEEEIRKRFKNRANIELAKHFPRALAVLVELMEEGDSSTRLKAAQLILEYGIGKPVAKTEIDAGNKTMQMLASALVLPSGEPAHPINSPIVIEGEFEEDEDL